MEHITKGVISDFNLKPKQFYIRLTHENQPLVVLDTTKHLHNILKHSVMAFTHLTFQFRTLYSSYSVASKYE